LVSLLAQMHIHIPPQLNGDAGDAAGVLSGPVDCAGVAAMGVSAQGLHQATGMFNLVAILAIVAITTVLVIGHQGVGQPEHGDRDCEAGDCGIFIVLGGYFLLMHPALAPA